LKPTNERVAMAFDQLGMSFEIRLLANEVRTARLAADALGCGRGQIANSLIFRNRGSGEAVLVMCAGDRRVDLKKVKSLADIDLGKADADFVRRQTGFAIGGVAPVGHTKPLRCLLDSSLQRFDEIWAAAGTPESIFCMSPQELQRMTGGSWLDLAED